MDCYRRRGVVGELVTTVTPANTTERRVSRFECGLVWAQGTMVPEVLKLNNTKYMYVRRPHTLGYIM